MEQEGICVNEYFTEETLNKSKKLFLRVKYIVHCLVTIKNHGYHKSQRKDFIDFVKQNILLNSFDIHHDEKFYEFSNLETTFYSLVEGIKFVAKFENSVSMRSLSVCS